MDLTLITSRLRRQDHYLNLDIFVADFKRMFMNCKCVLCMHCTCVNLDLFLAYFKRMFMNCKCVLGVRCTCVGEASEK